MLAGQVEQGGDGLFQRLAAAGDTRLQQTAFVERDEQGSEPFWLWVTVTLQLLLLTTLLCWLKTRIPSSK